MPNLYGVHPSPFVRKVIVGLTEKGVPFDLVVQPPFNQPPEYFQKSPLGKVPCYEDGDFILPDSSCILAYLEKAYPSPPLYPSDAQEYGRALWFEEWADSKLAETFGPIFFERYVKKNIFKQDPDEEKIAAAQSELPKYLDYLEGEIGDKEYLAGGQFSVADIAVGSMFVQLRLAGEDLDAARWPKVAAYVERVHSRPSFKSAIEAAESFHP